MALSGTLKDFGIADILQLIGHQTKTGRLTLTSGDAAVEVFFVDGNVVFASEKERNSKNLLGNLLLRAEMLSPDQLDEALSNQKRTLKRLGDVLVEMGAVTHLQLGQMMRLQTTETLYKLFSWKKGSYEFSQEDVDPSRSTFEPVRAESILLEGFRRMDEWPALKKKVPSLEATFEKARELDTHDMAPLDEAKVDADSDDGGKPGERHKLVYRLAAGGKNVQQVVDASRLGEFEALKATNDLVEWGYLELIAPPSGAAAVTHGIKTRGHELAQSGIFTRFLVGLACFAGIVLLTRLLVPALGSVRTEQAARRGEVRKVLAHDQVLRLESALELYNVEHGEYPPALEQLVEGQLVTAQDLRYPYRDAYYYRRTPQGFVLLPPLD